MVAMQSKDQGRSWSDFVPIEPYSNTTTAQVSAYGSVVARGDGSRVFSLWIQNVHDVQNLPGKAPSNSFRADMLGEFVWKYVDEHLYNIQCTIGSGIFTLRNDKLHTEA